MSLARVADRSLVTAERSLQRSPSWRCWRVRLPGLRPLRRGVLPRM